MGDCNGTVRRSIVIICKTFTMQAYMCKQRGIRLIKLPMKGTELDYANNLKKAFQSVHIFISSDTEEDVEIIKNTFERWRDSQ